MLLNFHVKIYRIKINKVMCAEIFDPHKVKKLF